ncbi:hypothetical protein NAEGRDRAFT_81004 [Naegleria gruberi]|uniref:Vps41 beta-propeller domain-containing protein n=1 Tax=Naegleria gruberi TaxID=5762 RepID=D2VRT1_NAEGR|nr:uncharacterized protein NAEGRDRAFT_81004 [Naegleria gruberi]EFC40517.1 hypothetical protein NAEGRDRAFT_81004 [Naegleria gruberi]|eukprot:XP_002673261.1 hypothetical protein NAEGRDRAFT_81004 [Naegleria gruberi strain NEG-M]
MSKNKNLLEEDDDSLDQGESSSGSGDEMEEKKNKLKKQPESEEEEDDDDEDDDDEEDEDDDEEDDDDEDDDEDDDDEESEEEEEYEPQLKYQRLAGSLPKDIFGIEGNYASALVVGEKFLALGTHLGYLYILDFEGNNNQQQKFRPHAETINDLTIDSTGEYIASCSNDGKVVVYNIYSALYANMQNPTVHKKILDPNSDANTVITGNSMLTNVASSISGGSGNAQEGNLMEFFFNRPMKSVALDPLYSTRSDKSVISGGKTGKLTMKRKGWFSYKELVIHKDEGEIHAVRWFGDFIAWANDFGVKVYDIVSNQKITYISRSSSAPRPDMYRPCLTWCQPDRFTVDNKQSDNKDSKSLAQLLIGWGQSVTLIVIKERRNAKEQKSQRYVEVLAMFEVEFYISGIVPYSNEDSLLILAYDEDEERDEDNANEKPKKKLVAPRPELRIMDLKGEEKSCDALSIKNFESYFATDYRLEAYTSSVATPYRNEQEEVYYILSPRDIVAARPRDDDDHVKWLMQKNRYLDAIKYCEANQSKLKDISMLDIGKKYLRYLLENKQYKEAAQMVPNVAGVDENLWEEWIYSFIDLKQFHVIIPFIPISKPKLKDAIYEMKLNYFLLNSPDLFLKCIKEWPQDLYNIQNITTVTSERILVLEQEAKIATLEGKEQESREATRKISLLQESLANLFMYEKHYDRALDIYFKLKRSDVFEFIQTHSLFSSVQDKILDLISFDEDRALRLCVEHHENIMVEQIIKQLKNERVQLLKYLDGLFYHNVQNFNRDRYHIIQVELYAEFDSKRLVWFLEQSQSYKIEQALKICEQHLNKPVLKFFEYLYKRDTVPVSEKTGRNEDQDDLMDDDESSYTIATEFVQYEKKKNINTNDDDASLEERNKQLYKGIVYLLGRMGNTNEALALIIDKLEDVTLAIEFVEKQPDSELYQNLLNKSLKKPKFISGLMDHISEHGSDYIDPSALVRKIPEQMDIEGLKKKLTRLITDFSQQKTLQEGCQEILQADLKQQSAQLFKQQRKGVKVRIGGRCALCGQRLTMTKEDNIMFMSGFYYHYRCYSEVVDVGANNKDQESDSEGTSTSNPSESHKKLYCVITHSREKKNTRRR